MTEQPEQQDGSWIMQHGEIYSDDEVQGDVALQGQQLYLDFLRREIRSQQLEEPPSLRDMPQSAVYSVGGDDECLSLLLDRFSKSDERRLVREKAEEVQLEDLSYEGFSGLLSGLFQDEGVTYERVLVLFCFCADVCLRALRETAARYFHLMTNFSLRFITSTLCVWVQARGGWGAVIQGLRQGCGSYGIAAIGCLAVVAVGAAIWSK